jgi:hypothetical protein
MRGESERKCVEEDERKDGRMGLQRVRILISLCEVGMDTESDEIDGSAFFLISFNLCCLFGVNPVVAYKDVARTRTDGIRDLERRMVKGRKKGRKKRREERERRTRG